jgi:hypothetical protein
MEPRVFLKLVVALKEGHGVGDIRDSALFLIDGTKDGYQTVLENVNGDQVIVMS